MKAKNIIPHQHKISREDRTNHKGHIAKVLWFTGLSGSGKSTIASKVEEELYKKGIHTYLLDGDNVRMGLNADLGFSLEDRTENIRRIGAVAQLMQDAGLIVLAAFVSPLQKDRDAVRALFNPGEFLEVFVDCPLEVCEERDVKGLYAKARRGEIKDFTGISSPYEIAVNPEIYINTAKQPLEEAVQMVLSRLDV